MFEIFMNELTVPHPISIVGFVLGILHAFLPMAELNEVIFKLPPVPPNVEKLS